MRTSVLTIGAWRRLLLITIAALVAALAVSFSAPQQAHAIRNPNVVLSSHKGWVETRATVQCAAAPCPGSSLQAYYWSGRAWYSYPIAGGQQVYAWPYTGEWHWIWTQRTGWLAIQTRLLDTGYRCEGIRCPIF